MSSAPSGLGLCVSLFSSAPARCGLIVTTISSSSVSAMTGEPPKASSAVADSRPRFSRFSFSMLSTLALPSLLLVTSSAFLLREPLSCDDEVPPTTPRGCGTAKVWLPAVALLLLFLKSCCSGPSVPASADESRLCTRPAVANTLVSHGQAAR
jgi:hypothetical protein